MGFGEPHWTCSVPPRVSVARRIRDGCSSLYFVVGQGWQGKVSRERPRRCRSVSLYYVWVSPGHSLVYRLTSLAEVACNHKLAGIG